MDGVEAHHEERTSSEGPGEGGGAARWRTVVGIGCEWGALRRITRSSHTRSAWSQKAHTCYGSPRVSCPGYIMCMLHFLSPFVPPAPPAHPLFHITGDRAGVRSAAAGARPAPVAAAPSCLPEGSQGAASRVSKAAGSKGQAGAAMPCAAACLHAGDGRATSTAAAGSSACIGEC